MKLITKQNQDVYMFLRNLVISQNSIKGKESFLGFLVILAFWTVPKVFYKAGRESQPKGLFPPQAERRK